MEHVVESCKKENKPEAVKKKAGGGDTSNINSSGRPMGTSGKKGEGDKRGARDWRFAAKSSQHALPLALFFWAQFFDLTRLFWHYPCDLSYRNYDVSKDRDFCFWKVNRGSGLILCEKPEIDFLIAALAAGSRLHGMCGKRGGGVKPRERNIIVLWEKRLLQDGGEPAEQGGRSRSRRRRRRRSRDSGLLSGFSR